MAREGRRIRWAWSAGGRSGTPSLGVRAASGLERAGIGRMSDHNARRSGPQPLQRQLRAAAGVGGLRTPHTHLGELRHLLGQAQVQLRRQLLELHLCASRRHGRPLSWRESPRIATRWPRIGRRRMRDQPPAVLPTACRPAMRFYDAGTDILSGTRFVRRRSPSATPRSPAVSLAQPTGSATWDPSAPGNALPTRSLPRQPSPPALRQCYQLCLAAAAASGAADHPSCVDGPSRGAVGDGPPRRRVESASSAGRRTRTPPERSRHEGGSATAGSPGSGGAAASGSRQSSAPEQPPFGRHAHSLRGGAFPAPARMQEEHLRFLFAQVLAQAGGGYAAAPILEAPKMGAPKAEAGGALAGAGGGGGAPRSAPGAVAAGAAATPPALDEEGLIVFLSRTESARRFHLTRRQVRGKERGSLNV